MNEVIRWITNQGKPANEWENGSDFLPALYIIVYNKLGEFFFHNLLANLFKQRYISFVTSYNIWTS